MSDLFEIEPLKIWFPKGWTSGVPGRHTTERSTPVSGEDSLAPGPAPASPPPSGGGRYIASDDTSVNIWAPSGRLGPR